MIYLEYIIITGIVLASVFYLFWFYYQLRLDHFYKIITQAIIKKQQDKPQQYFSSLFLQKIIKLLIKRRQKKALIFLSFGRSGLALAYLRKSKNDFLANILEAHFNVDNAIKCTDNGSCEEVYLTEQALMYLAKGNMAKVKQIMPNIKNHNLQYQYLEIIESVQTGDMLTASENSSLLAKKFHNKGAYYEEALLYLILGNIYKACFIEDVAQIMFKTALQIFKDLKHYTKIVESLGSLGSLMCLNEHFEEAEQYFKEALELNTPNAYLIYNQLGLMKILQKDFKAAKKYLNIAGKQTNFPIALELLAYVYKQLNNFDKALSLAKKAEDDYKANNLAAMLESMYFQAEIYFEKNELITAEKILRKIILIMKKNECNFYIGNAYNLLGLIYLHKKDLKRAKGLFFQSLQMEQKCERISGIAMDYANISLIEYKTGNIEQAYKTLKTAYEYASALGENELSIILKERLEKLNFKPNK